MSNPKEVRAVARDVLADLPAVTTIDRLLIALRRCSHETPAERPGPDISPYATDMSKLVDPTRRADTNRDGVKDGAEVRAGTNPRRG